MLEADAEAREMAEERVAATQQDEASAGNIFCVVLESNHWERTYLEYV